MYINLIYCLIKNNISLNALFLEGPMVYDKGDTEVHARFLLYK